MTLRILTCSNTCFIVEATKYLLRMSLKSVHSMRMCLTVSVIRLAVKLLMFNIKRLQRYTQNIKLDVCIVNSTSNYYLPLHMSQQHELS